MTTTAKKPGRNPEAQPEANPPAEVDVLQSFIDTLGDPTGYEVCVYEMNPRGGREILKVIGAAEFDHFRFAEEYGAGDYLAMIRDAGTKTIKTQRRFTVSARIARRAPTPAALPPAPPAPAPAVAPPADRTFELLLAMMQASNAQAAAAANQQTSIITALLTKPAEGIKLADILPLIAGNRKSSALGEIVEGMRVIEELAEKRAPAAAGEDSSASMLSIALPLLTKFLDTPAPAQQQQQQRRPQQRITTTATAGSLPAKPSPAAVPAAPARDDAAKGDAAAGSGVPHSATTPPAAALEAADIDAEADDQHEARMRFLGFAIVSGARSPEPDPQTYANLLLDTTPPEIGAVLLALPVGGIAEQLLSIIEGDDAADPIVREFVDQVETAIREASADDVAADEDGGTAGGAIDEDGLPRAGIPDARPAPPRTRTRKDAA